MTAIMTKYIPATNTKPARIKAWTEKGISVTVDFDYALESEERYAKAAAALMIREGWRTRTNRNGDTETQALIGGATKEGFAFVLVSRIDLTWDGLSRAFTTEDFIQWGLIKNGARNEQH